MARGKETPRQKMISMMYLVLTCLLALNVSKEVLDAFEVVNESVEATNEIFSDKIADTYTKFDQTYQINQVEVRPFWENAQEAKRRSQNLVSYIENLRDSLIAITERIPIDSARVLKFQDLKRKDETSITTDFFMGAADDPTTGRARELRDRIVAYKQHVINLVDEKYRPELKIGLDTEKDFFAPDGTKESWEIHHFYDNILAADITILNKLITEVYTAEFDVVNMLLDAIGAEDFKYDKIDAKVLPSSNYIFVGEHYTAEIIVAAYDTTQSPDVYIMRGVDSLPVSRMDEAQLITSENGRVRIDQAAAREGVHKYAGIVSVRNAAGTINNYHFSDTYVASMPTLTVSATKMNVFYVGVENSVSISVSGIPKANLIVSISCGSIRPDPNSDEWIVSVPPGFTEATVSVSARINGSTRRMGYERFRIKQLPDPVARIANKKEGFIDKEILIAAAAIVPEMPSDFEFNYQFRIKSFKMTMQRGFNTHNFYSDSERLSPDMITQITRTNRGQRITFDEIIALGPDSKERKLQPIILTIN